jgi:hypothetical protein
MKRTAVFFSFLFLLVLAACGGAEPETAVSPPADSDDTLSKPVESTGATAVTIQEFTPATNVTEAAEIREVDRTHGAEDPVVTIIEYGDFQ